MRVARFKVNFMLYGSLLDREFDDPDYLKRLGPTTQGTISLYSSRDVYGRLDEVSPSHGSLRVPSMSERNRRLMELKRLADTAILAREPGPRTCLDGQTKELDT